VNVINNAHRSGQIIDATHVGGDVSTATEKGTEP
jgi:hypothetical protein